MCSLKRRVLVVLRLSGKCPTVPLRETKTKTSLQVHLLNYSKLGFKYVEVLLGLEHLIIRLLKMHLLVVAGDMAGINDEKLIGLPAVQRSA